MLILTLLRALISGLCTFIFFICLRALENPLTLKESLLLFFVINFFFLSLEIKDELVKIRKALLNK